MESVSEFKNFYREKGIEELQCETNQWKSNLELTKVELEFFKNILSANIYNSKIPNLFEILELFKKEIEDINSEHLNLLDNVNFHKSHLKKKKHCKKTNCNQFYIEIHKKLDYDVAIFYEEINTLILRLYEFIQSVII
jgi:hypothetical protein